MVRERWGGGGGVTRFYNTCVVYSMRSKRRSGLRSEKKKKKLSVVCSNTTALAMPLSQSRYTFRKLDDCATTSQESFPTSVAFRLKEGAARQEPRKTGNEGEELKSIHNNNKAHTRSTKWTPK